MRQPRIGSTPHHVTPPQLDPGTWSALACGRDAATMMMLRPQASPIQATLANAETRTCIYISAPSLLLPSPPSPPPSFFLLCSFGLDIWHPFVCASMGARSETARIEKSLCMASTALPTPSSLRILTNLHTSPTSSSTATMSPS